MRSLGPMVLLLVAIAGHASARDDVMLTSEIIAEQRAIRDDIVSLNGRYAEMPPVKREQIVAHQDKLFSLLEGTTDTSELAPPERAEAFNAQQAILAAINNKEDERVVCERTRRVGSNRVTRVCKTVAQIRAEREAARKSMEMSQGQCMSAMCLAD